MRGDLANAAELYGEAEDVEEAARIFVLRGDGEPDVRRRLTFYAQAAQLAANDSDVGKTARKKRAELALALVPEGVSSAVTRHEIVEAARELEGIGEFALAANAYARANDKEGQARALQAAGDIENLEYLLSTEQHEERLARTKGDRVKDADLLASSGRRREALAIFDAFLGTANGAGAPEDPGGDSDMSLRERANTLRARRVEGPIVAVELAGERLTFVIGAEVVIGRTEGALTIPSNAVSRQHLRIFRGISADASPGEILVRDLGSRNGTQLRGVTLAGDLPVGDGLALTLGHEVPVRLTPSTRCPSALEIEAGGKTYVAYLGPTVVPVHGPTERHLELTIDAGGSNEDGRGWVTLVTNDGPCFSNDVALSDRVTLLVGDAISIARGAAPVLNVLPT